MGSLKPFRYAADSPSHCWESSDLQRLEAGRAAFEKILPKLRSAQILDLRDIPRTLRGPKDAGRFNFYLPSLAEVHPEDLARASQWLSHRDRCQGLVRIEACGPLCRGDYRTLATTPTGNPSRRPGK
jgi:hypothetical protein